MSLSFSFKLLLSLILVCISALSLADRIAQPIPIDSAFNAAVSLQANAQKKEAILNNAGTAIFAQSILQKTFVAPRSNNVTLLPSLIAEALENNPEIQAAYQEREAAQQRVLPT